jgi:hypothetical protein
MDYIDWTEENIRLYLSKQYNRLNDADLYFLDKVLRPSLSRELMLELLQNNHKAYNKFVKIGMQIDSDVLNIGCSYGSLEIVNDVLNRKIKPTKDNFLNIMECSNNRKEELIHILLSNGLELDTDMICKSIGWSICIPQLDKIIEGNKSIDTDALKKECIDTQNYMYPWLFGKSKEQIELWNLCRTGSLAQIKKFLNANRGTEIDIVCLQNACYKKKNKPVIEYMIDRCSIKPTKECLKAIASQLNCYTLDRLIEKIEI